MFSSYNIPARGDFMNLGKFGPILLIGMTLLSVANIFRMRKENLVNKKLLDILRDFNNRERFKEKLNAAFTAENKPSETAKLQALRIWGGAFHDDDEMFEEGLANLDLRNLIQMNGKKSRTGMNESAFFWIYLFTPNHLYSKKRTDLMERLYAKLDSISDLMKDEMVKQLGDANRKFYEGKEDRGLSFYERVMEGDYADINYFKELIGLYKQIISAMSAKLYEEVGKTDDFEACVPMLKEFGDTPLGTRWMKEIGLVLPEEEKPEEPEEEAEPVHEETE